MLRKIMRLLPSRRRPVEPCLAVNEYLLLAAFRDLPEDSRARVVRRALRLHNAANDNTRP